MPLPPFSIPPFYLASWEAETTPTIPTHSPLAKRVAGGVGGVLRSLLAIYAWTALGFSFASDYDAAWWTYASHLAYLHFAISMTARAVATLTLMHVQPKDSAHWASALLHASSEASFLFAIIVTAGFWAMPDADWTDTPIKTFIAVSLHILYLVFEAIDWAYFAMPVLPWYALYAYLLQLGYFFLLMSVYFVYNILPYPSMLLLPGVDASYAYATQVGASVGWAFLLSLWVPILAGVLYAYVSVRDLFSSLVFKEVVYVGDLELAKTYFANA